MVAEEGTPLTNGNAEGVAAGYKSGSAALYGLCRGGQALWPTNPNGGRAPHARPLFYSLTFSGQRKRPRGKGVGEKSSGLKKSQRGGSTPRPTLGSLSLLRNRGCSRPRPSWRPRSAGSAPLPPRRVRLCQPRRRPGAEGRRAHPGQPGDPSRTKRARRRWALSSRRPPRRGVRGRRRPDTPKPLRPPAGSGRAIQAASGSAGPAGDPGGSPRRVGACRDLLCAALGVRAAGGMRPSQLRSYLGEPCGDGSSGMLNFIHRVQEMLGFSHRFRRRGAEFVKTERQRGELGTNFAAVRSEDCEGKVLWLVLP